MEESKKGHDSAMEGPVEKETNTGPHIFHTNFTYQISRAYL